MPWGQSLSLLTQLIPAAVSGHCTLLTPVGHAMIDDEIGQFFGSAHVPSLHLILPAGHVMADGQVKREEAQPPPGQFTEPVGQTAVDRDALQSKGEAAQEPSAQRTGLEKDTVFDTGSVDPTKGHTVLDGQSTRSFLQLPSEHCSGSSGGHCGTTVQAESVAAQLLSGHKTGAETGHDTVAGQGVPPSEHEPSGHTCCPTGQVRGLTHSASVALHDLSLHSTGNEAGQLWEVGHKRKPWRQDPSGHMTSDPLHANGVRHCAADCAQALLEHNTQPEGQVLAVGQSDKPVLHEPSVHLYAFGATHAELPMHCAAESLHVLSVRQNTCPPGHVTADAQSVPKLTHFPSGHLF